MISTGDNLSRDRIQQLLEAVGKRTDNDTSQNSDAVDYNWRLSNYFGREQLKKIETFGQQTASNIAANFKKLYVCDFDVTVSSVSQHLAGEFMQQDDNNKKYYLAFAAKDQGIGVFVMPVQTANLWATQLLGDNKSEAVADKELSQLELSLLLDIASSAIKAVSDAYADAVLTTSGDIAKNKLPLELDSIQDLCKITVSVKKADAQQSSEAFFLILSEKLAAIAGQSKGENVSPQNVSKALQNYIQNIPVPVTVKFADININLQQLMSLQTDDTILLNKKINEPVDVIFRDKVVLRGRPAKFNNNYAVVITELSNKK